MNLFTYTNLDEGGCDSAAAVFFDENAERYVLAIGGPGFSPDGYNRGNWAWGYAYEINGEILPKDLSPVIEESDDPGEAICPFPSLAWQNDHDAVVELLRYLAEGVE